MKKVIIYSTPTCPWCKLAKEFLTKNSVVFEDKNIAGNQKLAQEMIDKSGQMGVPVIAIEEEIVIGFDQKKISELLEIKP